MNGGQGSFNSCAFEGNSASVSEHGYVAFEIEYCEFFGCICVVSNLWIWNVRIVFCSIHDCTWHVYISYISRMFPFVLFFETV